MLTFLSSRSAIDEYKVPVFIAKMRKNKHNELEEPWVMNKRLIVVRGFSGAGKGTVLKRVLEIEQIVLREKSKVSLSISDTTRPYRNSSDHYSFISKKELSDKVTQGYYLEHNEYNGNWYGTPIGPILDTEGTIILEIDVNGMHEVKDNKKLKGFEITTVFVAADADELLDRLHKRGNGQYEITCRINTALKEAEHILEYDYVLVNEDIDETALRLWAIVSGIPVTGDTWDNKAFCACMAQLQKGDLYGY